MSNLVFGSILLSRHIKKFDEIEWKNSTQARIAVDNARNAIRENPELENLMVHHQEINQQMQDPSAKLLPVVRM